MRWRPRHHASVCARMGRPVAPRQPRRSQTTPSRRSFVQNQSASFFPSSLLSFSLSSSTHFVRRPSSLRSSVARIVGLSTLHDAFRGSPRRWARSSRLGYLLRQRRLHVRWLRLRLRLLFWRPPWRHSQPRLAHQPFEHRRPAQHLEDLELGRLRFARQVCQLLGLHLEDGRHLHRRQPVQQRHPVVGSYHRLPVAMPEQSYVSVSSSLFRSLTDFCLQSTWTGTATANSALPATPALPTARAAKAVRAANRSTTTGARRPTASALARTAAPEATTASARSARRRVAAAEAGVEEADGGGSGRWRSASFARPA